MEQPHGNWIGGAWRPALGGRTYELASAGGTPLGRWPRSAAPDVQAALAAARAGGERWRAWTWAERRELLEDALAEDLFLGDPAGELAALFGARPAEVEPWVRAARRAGQDALGAPRRRRRSGPDSQVPQAPGTALVRVHGATLFAGLVARLWPLLLEGWTAILVSDPALPMLAAELCLALDHADLPAGAVSLLCDDGASVLRAGLVTPGIDFALVLDQAERGAEVLELAGRERPRVGVPGKGQGGPLPLRFEALSGSCALVRASDDPLEAARRVALGALGRSQALSGQGAGQIGWVAIHRRLFSAFTAALLAELDRLGEDPSGALAPLDPELPRHVERLRRLGLDEGATLLRGDVGTWFDGARLGSSPAGAALSGPQGGRGSHRRGREGRLEPLVFTNVEPRMRLARARRPAPVLRLLRADDDEAALRCADELDLVP